MMNQWMKKAKENEHTIFVCALAVIFLLSLIPILHLSGYVHATGDDYGYGYRAHHAWQDTHSLWEVFRAAAKTVRVYWIGWQGTWFTIFLMALQPEVFSSEAYWIVPWVMLAINIFATSLVLFEFLVKRLEFKKATFWCVDFLLLLAMIQFFPSTKSGIFWYNGTTHYIVPYCLAMLAIYCFLRFERSPRIGWFIGAFVCMTCLGGSSYLAALLAPIVLVYIWFWMGRRKKYLFWLAIPLLAECVGLYISFTAPGNSQRGGEEFGLHFGRVVDTILECFVEGAQTILVYLKEKPAAIFLMLFAAYLLYDGFSKRTKGTFSFRFPGVFAALMFAAWCAMFAPGIYAGVEVSGGVPNTVWQVFLLAFLASALYFAGWLAHKEKTASWKVKGFGTLLFGILLIASLGVVFVCKGTIKNTTIYQCYAYVASGQAEDYRKQMKECKEILLDDNIKEAYLPPINDVQGPLMHMPVTDDEEVFTNRVVKEFYRKEKVLIRENE